jgi:hypothetical protein
MPAQDLDVAGLSRLLRFGKRPAATRLLGKSKSFMTVVM